MSTTIDDVLSAVVGTAKKANAQDAVFRDKSSDPVDYKPDKSGPAGSPIKPKDFYWDQMTTILVSAILGLTVLDVVVEFFRGFGVRCFTPSTTKDSSPLVEQFTRDQASYINDYCYQSLPPTEYYTVFIIVHGLAIIAPHYLWSSLFGGYFDFFFDLVKGLNRLRNIKTGKYDARDFEISKKLEKEYTGRIAYFSYVVKLIAQFFLALTSLMFSVLFFDDFSPTFECPAGGVSETNAPLWPLNVTLTCVYTSLRFMSVIRLVDCILTSLVVVIIIFGLLWCCLRHTKELGHRAVAGFIVGSNLLQEHYIPPASFSSRFEVRIKSDLEFLVMRLFRTDSGHGQVFKELQVQTEVDLRTREEYELLQLFRNVQLQTGGRPRVEDLQNIFKHAGFKGTPRVDVFKRFSPLFGIKKKEICEEPLKDAELEKIADAIAEAGRDTVIALAQKLSQDAPTDQDLKEATLNILRQWVSQQRERRNVQLVARGNRHSSSRGAPEYIELQPLDHEEQLAYPDSERKELANYLQGMDTTSTAMKTVSFAVRYGVYLEPVAEVESFQNRIYGFLRITPESKMAFDISFGTTGTAHILAWAFNNVVSVNFDPYLQDDKSAVKTDTFFTNVTTVRMPTDIFTQKTENVAQVEDALVPIIYGPGELGLQNMQTNSPIYRVDFIVIGPIDNPAKVVTVTLMLDKLHTDEAIRRKAVLLAIRPLKIGTQDTSKTFTQYTPPPSLFESLSEYQGASDEDPYKKLQYEIREEIRTNAFRVSRDVHDHEVYQIPTLCGKIRCILEFAVYIYRREQGDQREATPVHVAERRDARVVRANNQPQTSNKVARLSVPVAGVLELVHNKSNAATTDSSNDGHQDLLSNSNSGLRRRATAPVHNGPTISGSAQGNSHRGTVASDIRSIEHATDQHGPSNEPSNEPSNDMQDGHSSLPSLTPSEEYWYNRAKGRLPAFGDDHPPPCTESSSSSTSGSTENLTPQHEQGQNPAPQDQLPDWGRVSKI